MLNRITNIFDDAAATTRAADRPWHVDHRPGMRLVWLMVLMSLPFVAVAGRLIYLQAALGADFVEPTAQTTKTTERIPSRDGRILASDGRVLANDIQRFRVQVHYRWLEDPPDPRWLRRQALSQLDRSERRDTDRVDAETEVILARRDRMWQDLAVLAEVAPHDLQTQRDRIQRQVERIVGHVERRRQQPAVSQTDQVAPADSGDMPWWQDTWRTVVTTLTTSPQRERIDPIVVREELQYHDLLTDVLLEAAAEIESHPGQYPGLEIEVRSERVYLQKSLAAHVVGSRLPIDDEGLAARRTRFPDGDPLDYQRNNRIGRTGVERSYDRFLHGSSGRRTIVKNRHGEIVSSKITRRPVIGRDITLTLDMPLQERVESLLAEVLSATPPGGRALPVPSGACLIALDVRTGAILAAASAPTFDISQLIHPSPQDWQRLLDDPRRPFFPRITQMALPPGSVFKTLTAVAAIESGQIDPDAHHHCQGYLDRPDRHRCYIYRHYGVGHGDMDLSDAICRSCNVYFFQAARTIGPGKLVGWADRFGFGRRTGVDLPHENPGQLPTPNARASSSAARWYPGDTLGLAIGQSRLTTTPLQIARMMAVVANDGYLVTPHVVRSISSNESGEFQVSPSHPRRRLTGLREGTLARIREGLAKVVSHPKGTGYKRVRLAEVAIAGKTGTAEVGGSKPDHAWFAGYVPADRPRIAFAVVLEHAGSGGRAAGPVARRFIESLLELGLIQPRQIAKSD